MTFNSSADIRTCLVCGEPVANHLRGYLDSLRACEPHLAEWEKSREHYDAFCANIRGAGIGYAAPFEAWAAKRQGQAS